MAGRSAKQPRRKAKQERSRATVDLILEAAAQVLIGQGYALATTNRIAQAAGVSIGTLYEYYANKEDVFDALIRRELAALVLAIRDESPDPAAGVGETIGQLLVAAMAAMQYGPQLFRSLEQVPGAKFRHQLADARGLVVRFVRQRLEEHRAELRVKDLDLAAFVIVSAAEGVGGNAPAELFDERLQRELTRLIEAYLTQQ